MTAVLARLTTSSAGRLRWAPVTVLAGVVATGAVAVSMSGTLAAYTASITHSGDSTNTGTLVMQESSGAMTCTSTDGTGNGINGNAATCTGINHYGGQTLSLGASSTTTVSIRNTGTVAATGFTVSFSTCTQSNSTTANGQSGSATDVCSRFYLGVNVTINGTTTAMTGSALSLAALATNTYTLPTVPAGATASVAMGIGLGSAIGNTYQGLTATQPITFQFTT